MTLAEYARYCCTGRLPDSIEAMRRKSPIAGDIVDIFELLGWLIPAGTLRPGPCDPEIKVTRSIEVAAATLNEDGTITPSEERVISICAPMNKALMVAELEITPENQTAENQPFTQPVYKRVNIAGFGEWCLPFEPLEAAGQFVSVQNILVPPQAGFSAYVQNYNPTNPALYHLKARMWASC
jgi:hypothetical protein